MKLATRVRLLAGGGTGASCGEASAGLTVSPDISNGSLRWKVEKTQGCNEILCSNGDSCRRSREETRIGGKAGRAGSGRGMLPLRCATACARARLRSPACAPPTPKPHSGRLTVSIRRATLGGNHVHILERPDEKQGESPSPNMASLHFARYVTNLPDIRLKSVLFLDTPHRSVVGKLSMFDPVPIHGTEYAVALAPCTIHPCSDVSGPPLNTTAIPPPCE